MMEATPRIELGMEVLQTSALPLGYVAARFVILVTGNSPPVGGGSKRGCIFNSPPPSPLFLEETLYGRVHDQDAPAW
jgi:hypothetical protein